MTAWETVVGHDWARELLAGAIRHGRVGHAYLLTGPAHVGKTTLARLFAQALNCQAADPDQRPCGQCRTCQLINSDRHPDVRLVEPQVSDRGNASLKIDQIRQLQQDLNLSAYEGRYKIAIVTQFETANLNAANAFLKTLEEPPNKVVLLLTAVAGDTLLATVTSRCRTVGLRPLPTRLIEESLKTRWHLAPEQARLLAHLADGRLGWAVQASQNDGLLREREQYLAELYDVLNGRRLERFQLADKLTRAADPLAPRLQTWLSWWRDLLLLTQAKRHKSQLTISNIDQQDQFDSMTPTCSTEQALQSLKQTSLALWQLERNANARLVLENLLLTYPLPASQ